MDGTAFIQNEGWMAWRLWLMGCEMIYELSAWDGGLGWGGGG
jgi:hypothetical protein